MDIEQAFILFAIIVLLFIGGLIFLIVYGILKKKKAFWVTGVVIASICMLMYFYNCY